MKTFILAALCLLAIPASEALAFGHRNSLSINQANGLTGSSFSLNAQRGLFGRQSLNINQVNGLTGSAFSLNAQRGLFGRQSLSINQVNGVPQNVFQAQQAMWRQRQFVQFRQFNSAPSSYYHYSAGFSFGAVPVFVSAPQVVYQAPAVFQQTVQQSYQAAPVFQQQMVEETTTTTVRKYTVAP